jgi:hypothetical protein
VAQGNPVIPALTVFGVVGLWAIAMCLCANKRPAPAPYVDPCAPRSLFEYAPHNDNRERNTYDPALSYSPADACDECGHDDCVCGLGDL